MRLEAVDLSFRYASGERDVLCKAKFCLMSGERLGIVAPSGQGKTTLCELLAGYRKPREGRVLLDERPIEEYKGSCPVQLIWQTPQEAVDPMLPLKYTLQEAGVLEPYIMSRLGVQPQWLERYPQTLSGGELQRICIARALGKNTRFLLCDEITAMLDLITQSQVWDFLIREQTQRKLGMLVVSHSTDLLRAVCETVLPWPFQ